MNGKFILLSGSAELSCPPDKLDAALKFVSSFTEEILRRGGGIVVHAGDEARATDERGKPHIFDWVALRAVERYVSSATEPPRPCARIIMSDEARELKMDEANLALLRDLEQRNAVETYPIRREVYTGGAYREAMSEESDAMLAIGGGIGTYSAAQQMMDHGKPILPLDLKLGALVGKGDGAVSLHREMATNPEWFFPTTYNNVANKTGLISLDRGINNVDDVARAVAELLAAELQSAPPSERPAGVKERLVSAWRFVKELVVALSAIRIIDWLRNL